MKKSLSLFVLFALSASVAPVSAQSSSGYQRLLTPNYSASYLEQRALRYRSTEPYLPLLTRNVSTSSNTSSYVRPSYTRTVSSSSRYNYNTASPTRTIQTTSSSQSSNYARVTVNPVPQRQPFEEIPSTTIPVLELGIRHQEGSRSSLTFQEAFVVDSLTFQMYAQAGIANDPNDFELVVGDDSASFDRNGSVTITFPGSVRIAAGESTTIPVGVRFTDPDLISRSNGNFRLRLLNARVSGELQNNLIPSQVIGTGNSDVIAFQPSGVASGTGTGQFTSIPSNGVFSSNIELGGKSEIVAVNFGASSDDLLIEELTIVNTTTGNAVDNLVESVQAVDRNTGEILGTTRFISGRATFDFRPEIYVGRSKNRSVVFVADVVGTLPTNGGSNSFLPNIDSSSLVVRSASNGRLVSSSRINLSVDNNTFSVVGGSINITDNNQPESLIVGGSLATVYRFQINNPSGQQMSVGRVSFNLFPSGVEFPGGISTDDFEVRQIVGTRDVPSNFSITSASGSTVVADASNEIYISPGTSMQFALRAKINNVGSSQGDSLAVGLKGDSFLNGGTLSSLRGSGVNFIWSDHSARPHVSGSSDWRSGYLVPFPSDPKLLRR